MPRRKSENPRTIIVPIRLTKWEREEISKRARDTPMSQWIRQVVFASLEQPPAEKPTSPEIQPKHSPEQAPKVQASTPPPGEWAKHPAAHRLFKACYNREPEGWEWEFWPHDEA